MLLPEENRNVVGVLEEPVFVNPTPLVLLDSIDDNGDISRSSSGEKLKGEYVARARALVPSKK